jgi:cytoskeletal protein RodZ
MLTAGTLLQNERKKQGLGVDEVSAATKINRSYIEALEENSFDKFPSSVYAKGFLQSYAKFLGLNVDRVLALYRRSIGEAAPQPVEGPKKSISQSKFILTPGVVIISVIAIIVLTTFAYLVYQFYNFQKPPPLTIESPGINTRVEDTEVTIEGSTEPGMFVTINDEPVKVSTNGMFETTVSLSRGTNSIIVKARHPDNIGKEAVVTLTIESAPPIAEAGEPGEEEATQETDEAPEEITEFSLEVAIAPENAWLEVEVDGQQVFASVAPAQSNYTYTAEKSIYIRSGKVTSTTITLDGEVQTLFTEGGGVASVICELKEKEVTCRQP